MTEVLQTPAGTLWWRDDGFWHFRMNPYYEMSSEEARIFTDAIEAHTGGRKTPLLIDRTHSFTPQFSAWLYAKEVLPRLFSAIAYYAPERHKRIASEYVAETFLKGVAHVAIFDTLQEAEAYLRTFV
jgi:hypothetical protein